MVVGNMKKRVISAIIMIGILIPILIVGGIPYCLAIGILASVAYKELIEIRKEKSNLLELSEIVGKTQIFLRSYINQLKY